MPIGPARMSIMDHIAELRRRLTIIVVALLAVATLLYFVTPTIIDIILDPVREYLPRDGQIAIFSTLGGFSIRFKVALFVGAIVIAPLIIWEVMAFFLPALKPSERKWVVPTVIAMVVLFFVGMIFCYFIIIPAAFEWLVSQSTEIATVVPNAEDFISITLLIEIGFGVAFEMPIVIFYLIIFKLVKLQTFRKHWRGIYVGLLVFSAIVTPDASPVTMFLMFAALIVLYEGSLALATLLARKEQADTT